MLAKGLSYRDKNQVRKMHAAGQSPLEISRAIRCEVDVIQRHIAFLGSSQKLVASSGDKFGPLPGSPEWDKLSPGARSGLTRKRQNAERAQDADHSTV